MIPGVSGLAVSSGLRACLESHSVIEFAPNVCLNHHFVQGGWETALTAYGPIGHIRAPDLGRVIAPTSEDNAGARWVKHKRKRPVHSFQAHVGTDANTALVEEVSVTSANINDLLLQRSIPSLPT